VKDRINTVIMQEVLRMRDICSKGGMQWEKIHGKNTVMIP